MWRVCVCAFVRVCLRACVPAFVRAFVSASSCARGACVLYIEGWVQCDEMGTRTQAPSREVERHTSGHTCAWSTISVHDCKLYRDQSTQAVYFFSVCGTEERP